MLDPIHLLRQGKHQASRLIHKGSRSYRRWALNRYSRTHLPNPSPSDHPHEFVNREPSGFDPEWDHKPVPRTVFTLWTGNNPLTPNRERSLADLREGLGLELTLVTPANLGEFLHPDWPLHPAYEHLSLVHRSDYLRCYLLHLHGGGYVDLKRPTQSWQPAWHSFSQDKTKMLMGYPEVDALAVPELPGPLGKELRRHFTHLPGMTAFMARPRTPLTALWFEELHRRLDYYLPDLIQHPGGIWGNQATYPIRWTGILGDILHPLAYYFHEHVELREDLKPTLMDYR